MRLNHDAGHHFNGRTAQYIKKCREQGDGFGIDDSILGVSDEQVGSKGCVSLATLPHPLAPVCPGPLIPTQVERWKAKGSSSVDALMLSDAPLQARGSGAGLWREVS